MRSTTHWPGGGVQSSDPSLPIFDVRSTTVALPRRVRRGDGRRPEVREAGERHEGRLLLEAGHARTGVQDQLGHLVLGRGGGSGRSMSIGGGGGGVTNATLKTRADQPARRSTVFCAGRAARDVDDLTEALAVVARLEVGAAPAGGPNGALRARAIARDTPRIATGLREGQLDPRLLADRRHREGGGGLTKSPSASSDGSIVALLDVTTGCRSVIGTSAAGTRRYAMTLLSL